MNALQPSDSTRTTTVRSLLAEVEEQLLQAGIEQPRLEAAWLVEHVTRLAPLRLLIESERVLDALATASVRHLVSRRAQREPLQYLLGTQEFLGRDFRVDPAVLIPRSESSLLVEVAIEQLRSIASPIVADVGTGSGCLAISIAKALPSSTIYALDLSSEALAVACDNIRRHAAQGQVRCRQGELLSPLEDGTELILVHAVVSNPPYIADPEWERLQPEVRDFEPQLALRGGVDGMEMHRRLVKEAPRYLRPGGWLLMEVGYGQASAVRRFAEQSGPFRAYDTRRDAAGIERVVCLERAG
jgi:release factor glutamine methyltransferase